MPLRRFRFLALGAPRAAVGRLAEAAVELIGDDLLHVLGDQADDQIDDALLAAALVAPARLCLAVVEQADDLLGHQANDGVDDALLFEIAAVAPPLLVAMVLVAVVLVAVMILVVVLVAVVAVAARMVAVPIAAVPRLVAVVVAATAVAARHAFQRLQPFENFPPIVVPHDSLPGRDQAPQRRAKWSPAGVACASSRSDYSPVRGAKTQEKTGRWAAASGSFGRSWGTR